MEGAAASRPPDWTRLGFQRCPNCPLDPKVHERCPPALRLVDVVEFFKNCEASQQAEIVIGTDSREIRKKTSVLKGLSSLMGLYMVVSGCPVLDKLRPMAFTHLPFSNLEETRFRAIGMYLIAQYLRQRRGEKADWTLAQLSEVYRDVDRVNEAFFQRLRSIEPRDASLNALVNLDTQGSFTLMSLEQELFSDLDRLFEPYLQCDPAPPPPQAA